MDLLTTEQVAAYLGLAPSTLNSWRSADKGPAYIKAGNRVRYSRSEVDYWLGRNARGSQRNDFVKPDVNDSAGRSRSVVTCI